MSISSSRRPVLRHGFESFRFPLWVLEVRLRIRYGFETIDSLAMGHAYMPCDPILLSNNLSLSSWHVTYTYTLETGNAQGYTRSGVHHCLRCCLRHRLMSSCGTLSSPSLKLQFPANGSRQSDTVTDRMVVLALAIFSTSKSRD